MVTSINMRFKFSPHPYGSRGNPIVIDESDSDSDTGRPFSDTEPNPLGGTISPLTRHTLKRQYTEAFDDTIGTFEVPPTQPDESDMSLNFNDESFPSAQQIEQDREDLIERVHTRRAQLETLIINSATVNFELETATSNNPRWWEADGRVELERFYHANGSTCSYGTEDCCTHTYCECVDTPPRHYMQRRAISDRLVSTLPACTFIRQFQRAVHQWSEFGIKPTPFTRHMAAKKIQRGWGLLKKRREAQFRLFTKRAAKNIRTVPLECGININKFL